jgi:hypothetical protein
MCATAHRLMIEKEHHPGEIEGLLREKKWWTAGLLHCCFFCFYLRDHFPNNKTAVTSQHIATSSNTAMYQ